VDACRERGVAPVGSRRRIQQVTIGRDKQATQAGDEDGEDSRTRSGACHGSRHACSEWFIPRPARLIRRHQAKPARGLLELLRVDMEPQASLARRVDAVARDAEEMAMACEKLPTCIFFNDQMENMPAVAELLKAQFCRGTFEECARFCVAQKLGGAAVPRDLFPGDAVRAAKLLAAAG